MCLWRSLLFAFRPFHCQSALCLEEGFDRSNLDVCWMEQSTGQRASSNFTGSLSKSGERVVLEIREIEILSSSLEPPISLGGVYVVLQIGGDREKRQTELISYDDGPLLWTESFCLLVETKTSWLHLSLHLKLPGQQSLPYGLYQERIASLDEVGNYGKLTSVTREFIAENGEILPFRLSFSIYDASKDGHVARLPADSMNGLSSDEKIFRPFDFDELWEQNLANRHLSSDLQRDWTGHLAKGKLIGGGSFGDVFFGVWRDIPETIAPPPVVVKTVRLHLLNSQGKMKLAQRLSRREVVIWQRLKHENIVPFLGIAHLPDDDLLFPSVVLQYMPNGTLREYVRRYKDADHDGLLLGIARGIEYLHTFKLEGVIQDGIVHGDLNGVNVLVNYDGTPCIGDFGLSRILSDETLWLTTATSAAGTVRWMAPELLDGTQVRASKESDVYAYGMTAIEVLTGEIPFSMYPMDGTVLFAVTIRDEQPSRPANSSGRLWELLVRCWSRAPSERPKIDEVVRLMHSWQ